MPRRVLDIDPRAPGALLIAPAGSGDRSADVLCVFDRDETETGAVFALLLNQPTDQLAQPVAFSLFSCGEAPLWWGGPTEDPFAIAALPAGTSHVDHPVGKRIHLTARSALYLPGRDHPPPSAPEHVRIFQGSIWLSPEQVDYYREEGLVLRATDDVLFDCDPATLADRVRAVQEASPDSRSSGRSLSRVIPLTPLEETYRTLHDGIGEQRGQVAQIARADAFIKAPGSLAQLLVTSVGALSSYDNRDEGFYRRQDDPRVDDRKPLPEVPSGSPKSTPEAVAVLGSRPVWDLPEHAIRFRYIDRELRPLRTTGGATYDRSTTPETTPRLAASTPMLDALLVDDDDGTPIVSEIKIGGDQNQFYALIQALMHVAALSTEAQRERLANYYSPAGSSEFRFCRTGPMDVYLLTVDAPQTGTRPQLATRAEGIARQLLHVPAAAAIVRQVICLRLEVGPGPTFAWSMAWRARGE